jgi:potassium channel LctB
MIIINWRERIRTLSYTYSAVGVGLAVSLLLGSVHLNTLNFWLTAAVAFVVVTVFDVFLLAMLEDELLTPSHFLFRMMIMVVLMQSAFAGIYHFAGDAASYLSRDGVRVTDFVDALYFSGVTLLTVGYGDIVPVGDFRFTAVAEVYGGTLFLFSFFTWGLGVMANRHLSRSSRLHQR